MSTRVGSAGVYLSVVEWDFGKGAANRCWCVVSHDRAGLAFLQLGKTKKAGPTIPFSSSVFDKTRNGAPQGGGVIATLAACRHTTTVGQTKADELFM